MNFIKNSLVISFAIITGIFTFVPESFFEKYEWITQKSLEGSKLFTHIESQEINIVVSRVMCFIIICVATMIICMFFLNLRRCIMIKYKNCLIRVEYGDILKKKKCKRVINFDECFTTSVGDNTADINPDSICGQYLSLHPNLNIQKLIEAARIKPARSKSKYLKKTRYDSGTVVPNGDDLLMSFAKLDVNGKGRFFNHDEYIACLDLLWKEIENNYSEKDVCIPILGAGTTCFDTGSGEIVSQQDLLDTMILSYKLSSHKIKAPHKLCIVCKKTDGFSLKNLRK